MTRTEDNSPLSDHSDYWTEKKLLSVQRALSKRRDVLRLEIPAGLRKQRIDRVDSSTANVLDSGEQAAIDAITDIDLSEITRDDAELRAIDAALQRVEAHTYGTCVACGGDVELARLAVDPAASRCYPCQSQAEAQMAKPPRA